MGVAMNENGVSPAEFAAIAGKYEANLVGWAATVEQLRREQTRIRELETETDYREAEISLTVEGKNSEERKAHLTLALRADPAYQQWRRRADDCKGEVVHLQDEIADYRDRLSLYKRQMDYCIAFLDYLPRPPRHRARKDKEVIANGSRA